MRQILPDDLQALPDRVFQVIKIVPLRTRVLFVIGLFVSSIFEIVGLASVAPLLTVILADAQSVDGASKSAFGLLVRNGFAHFGVPFDTWYLTALIIVCFALKSLLNIATVNYVNGAISSITTSIRISLIKNLLYAKWGYFVRQPLGKLVNVTGPDASVIGDSFSNVANLIVNAVQLSIYVGISFAISPRLTIFTIVSILLTFVVFGSLVRSAKASGARYVEQIHRLSAHFTDTIIGIKTLKAMGRNARFAKLFLLDAQQIQKSMRAKILSAEFASELMDPLIVAIFVFGFIFASRGQEISFIEILVMGLLFARSIMVVNQAQKTYLRIAAAEGTYTKVAEVIAASRRQRECDGGSARPSFVTGCAARNIGFSYGKKEVLQDLNLEVPAGEVVCIVGDSGAGKTTLIDLFLGLNMPTKGQILIDGTDLAEIDRFAWRQMVGYVAQEIVLFHDTVYNNVTLGEERYTEQDVRRALDAAGALAMVEECPAGLHEVVGERGTRMSGGQRQRIAIARALIHQPRLLILDEATSALDHSVEKEICGKLCQLVRKSGLTILAVSHRPIWQEAANRTYRLEAGCLTRLHAPANELERPETVAAPASEALAT